MTTNSYRICRHPQFRSIVLEPRHPSADLLQAPVIVAADDPAHAYRVERRHVSLLDFGIANAGLAQILVHTLRRQGLSVELAPAWVNPLAPPCACENPHVAAFMADNPQGVIRHDLDADGLAIACFDIIRAFPEARIAFVVTTNKHANRFHRTLIKRGYDAALAVASRSNHVEQRVIVATPHGLGHVDVHADELNLLIVLDASKAIAQSGQQAIFATGRPQLFGFMRNDCVMPPSHRDLVMAMFGPEEVTLPRIGHQERLVQVAWQRVEGGRRLPDRIDDIALYRRGIAGHAARNALVAQLAAASVGTVDTNATPAGGETAEAPVNPSRRTLIVVRDLDHGIELARRLPGWPLLAHPAANLAGLSAGQLRVKLNSNAASPDAGRAISTLVGMASVDLTDFDVLIWAAGGFGLPEFKPTQLMVPVVDSRPLLWIDFSDHHHGRLRRASNRRGRAYRDRGWFSVGTPPTVGRIERFLDQRSGGVR